MDEKMKGAIIIVCNAMVKSEMETAEALADLARMQKWNLQEVGESSNHQVKTESLYQHESVAIHTAALCLSSGSTEVMNLNGWVMDLWFQGGVGGQPRYENIYPITTNRANIIQDAMLHKPSTIVTRSHAYLNCSKSRHKMTEEEKEARRIRRVLANRESARQTIRRRRALYEELNRKAASLAQENESLKMEMDLAVQEYSSLKTTNESFRLQMVKAVSSELHESQAYTKQINTEMLTSSPASCSYVIYSQPPPLPFIWPAFVQPPPYCQTPNLVNLYPEQLNSENKDFPNLPLYFLPCPIFYPVPNHGAAPPLGPSLDLKTEQCIIPRSYSYVTSSSTTTAGYGFEEVKGEASNLKTIHQVPFNCREGPPVLVKPIASVKPIPCQQSEFISTHQEIPSTMPNALDTMNEKKLDFNMCPSKKHTDAAADEARKRRKELTKLKSLHVRDFRRV